MVWERELSCPAVATASSVTVGGLLEGIMVDVIIVLWLEFLIAEATLAGAEIVSDWIPRRVTSRKRGDRLRQFEPFQFFYSHGQTNPGQAGYKIQTLEKFKSMDRVTKVNGARTLGKCTKKSLDMCIRKP
jgi:hypothetical protein